MAEKTSSSNFGNGFNWLATILGFVVDAIALISFFSTFELKNVNTPDVPPNMQIPKIKIVTITPELKSIASVFIFLYLFMLIFYIGSAFYKKEQKIYNDEEEGFSGFTEPEEETTITPVNKEFPLLFSTFGTSFFALIFTLWSLVFYFPDSILWEYAYSIFAIWIIGTFFSMAGISLRSLDNKKMSSFLKTFLIVSVFCAPLLGLIGEWLFHTTLLLSIFAIVRIVLLSAIYMIVIYLLTALISGATWMIAKWYYNTN